MNSKTKSAAVILAPILAFGSSAVLALELPLEVGFLFVLSSWLGMLAMHIHGRMMEARSHIRWLDRELAERYGFRSSE